MSLSVSTLPFLKMEQLPKRGIGQKGVLSMSLGNIEAFNYASGSLIPRLSLDLLMWQILEFLFVGRMKLMLYL